VRAGKAGKLADQLVRVDLVILDELGYLGSRQELCVAVRHRRTNR
jgi:hypothetical protein